jgi:hypothetical protein
MDLTRLDTAAVLAGGILSRPAPKRNAPPDAERFDASAEQSDGYEGYAGNQAVIAAIDSGKVVTAFNYYGIPELWKAADGTYRGELFQYCNCAEAPTFATAIKAAEWFAERYETTRD